MSIDAVVRFQFRHRRMVLSLLMRRPPDGDSIRGSEDALDLLRFWTSALVVDMRRQLGLVK